RPAAAPPSGLL
ncbi:hypothetical protein BN1708_018228, partial [Verticillium longisporum]